MEEISLRDYFLVLKRRKWLIISLTVIFILLAGSINHFVIGVKYKAYTTLIVDGISDNGKDEGDQKYLNQKIINNYSEIAKSNLVMDEVKKNLNLDSRFMKIIEKVELNIVPDANILNIEVTGKDSKLVVKVTDEIAKVSMKRAKDIAKIENIRIIDKAQYPKTPMKSNLITNIIIGGIIGLMTGIFMAFFLEYLDNTIKTPRDIKRYLGLSVTGIVPLIEKELVLYEEPGSFAAESYRALRTNIQSLKTDKKNKIISFTSSFPNEESSTVVANIATSIAKAKEKVLLIDGDLRNPSIHKIFDLDNHIGLSNILNDNIDYKNAINEIKIEKNLHILTSGSTISNPAELLSSNEMKEFIEKARDDYDMVILNTPSLGIMTDAAVISTIVDGTILVYEVGESNVDEAKMGKALLEKVNANILGAVLNKMPTTEKGYYKYYYDSYLYYKEKDNSYLYYKEKDKGNA